MKLYFLISSMHDFVGFGHSSVSEVLSIYGRLQPSCPEKSSEKAKFGRFGAPPRGGPQGVCRSPRNPGEALKPPLTVFGGTRVNQALIIGPPGGPWGGPRGGPRGPPGVMGGPPRGGSPQPRGPPGGAPEAPRGPRGADLAPNWPIWAQIGPSWGIYTLLGHISELFSGHEGCSRP